MNKKTIFHKFLPNMFQKIVFLLICFIATFSNAFYQNSHQRGVHQQTYPTRMGRKVVVPTITTTEYVDPSCHLISSDLESELCSDLSHLILDFLTVWSPDALPLRILVLFGRIFSILADYIPDSFLTRDELILQSCLLALSADAAIKSVLATPSKKYDYENTSFRDRRAYQTVFRGVFTWTQYECLFEFGALEWVTFLNRGDVTFENQEDLLLVYQGVVYDWDADIIVSGDKFKTRATHIMGDFDFLGEKLHGTNNLDATYTIHSFNKKGRELDSRALGSNVNANSNTNANVNTKPGYRCIEAGKGNTSILRINANQLVALAKANALFDDRIKKFCFNIMYERLVKSQELRP